jgi:hypothetical protein
MSAAVTKVITGDAYFAVLRAAHMGDPQAVSSLPVSSEFHAQVRQGMSSAVSTKM